MPDDTPALPRDRGGRRIYSEHEIATALALLEANNGNVLATCQALSIPENTLREWKNGGRPLARNPELRDQIRAQLAERARGVADRMLTRMETADLEEVSVKDAAIVFGIVSEKQALLDGDATQITEHRTDQDDDKAQRIRSRYLRKLTPVQVAEVQSAPAQTPETEKGEESGPK